MTNGSDMEVDHEEEFIESFSDCSGRQPMLMVPSADINIVPVCDTSAQCDIVPVCDTSAQCEFVPVCDTSTQCDIVPVCNTSAQCELLTTAGRCSIEQYRNNPDGVHYYTGFDDYDHFMCFF